MSYQHFSLGGGHSVTSDIGGGGHPKLELDLKGTDLVVAEVAH